MSAPHTISKPNMLRGMVRFWLYDVGSASFVGISVMALVLMLLLLNSGTKLAAVPIMLSMIQASICAAIAWQLNRLAATEWANLVPHYSRNIVAQCVLVFAVFTLMTLSISLMIDIERGVEQVMLATLIGISFIYFCRRVVNGFYASFVLFMLLPLLPYLLAHLPTQWFYVLPVALLVMCYLLWREIKVLAWHSDARSVYLNGLEMGWVWMPSMRSLRFMSYLDRFLHPANFFIGPMLSLLLVAMLLMALGVGIVNYVADVQFPILFMLSQFSAVACTLVHWSRIQRWRAVETLYVLPGFDGRQGMIAAFIAAQYRLLAVITLNMMLVATLVCSLNAQFSWGMWIHVVLSTFSVCGILLGLGSAAKGVLHISLSMLVVILHSGWLSSSLLVQRQGESILLWIWMDLGFVVISMLTLWWGKKKLWKHDLG
ncbi:hypothetical protein [Shewanella sp. Isolate11]|uniref:hypothetical protein n=1 Tax=Shewanella sp. Isolate11 TaxID=2908530 RepID=UPI001EFCED8B|nr:hypothetical protein [Shewanella sp. Isolate11]MCG9698413.1 hypothetical protein [Shewanella sp. Isolate11]